MASMTNVLENRVLDFLFRGGPLEPANTTWLALFTSPPTDAVPGNEPDAPSYARAPIPSTMVDWSGTDSPTSTTASGGSSGTIYNISEVSFPDPQEDWGMVTHIGMFDAEIGGTYLFWAPLAVPRNFVPGDVNIKFKAAELSVQIDN